MIRRSCPLSKYRPAAPSLPSASSIERVKELPLQSLSPRNHLAGFDPHPGFEIAGSHHWTLQAAIEAGSRRTSSIGSPQLVLLTHRNLRDDGC